MGEKPFIKFYPSDFLGGTSGLSPAERGCYITLLCLMYEADGPIERHDARLSRRCGAPKAAFVRILEALIDEGKIIQSGNMLSNNRAEKAIVDRTNRSQIATHAARSRWTAQTEKTETNQGADDADAMPAQCSKVCQPEPEPEPDIKTEPIGSAKKRRRPEIELPDGWVPSDRNIQDAIDRGLSHKEIDHEADAFRNHHHSKQSKYRDWDAAWRTWIANSVKWKQQRSTNSPRVAGSATAAEIADRGARWAASRAARR